ncbi:hypothetical protein NKI36_06910 [Mesorhizobium caraganae]|uniref:Uncharacterized protein n=1 Tax=Mesorhizobium caraganae TaxID=483206 RepID=A0ABV1YVS3_9HYPH
MQDPCDHWLVYDLMSALPAEVEGRLLMGLARREAEQIAEQANTGFARQPAHSPVSRPRFA